ncbi:uncharacterized protein METZ01_LOCUS97132 [marine metagenome]|uniref:Uncharacterized protein n=1 Tax=marine metagenome TaxID=408172 RepID=A0A381VWZ5_9ZZZZ
MARDDGIRYGAGGVGMIQEIAPVSPVNPDPKKSTAKRGRPKKEEVQILEERIHDTLPSDVESMEEE